MTRLANDAPTQYRRDTDVIPKPVFASFQRLAPQSAESAQIPARSGKQFLTTRPLPSEARP